jgi:amino acid transporter
MSGEARADRITLVGGVSMGTGVMIGAGIFALTGQIAELAGPLFPLAFLAGAIVTGFSAYTYIRMTAVWPSSGGIAMILEKAYGPGAVAAGASMLMALSMIIAQSLVARTFGTYAVRPFDLGADHWLVPTLGVALIALAWAVNRSGARSVGRASLVMALLKIGGVAAFGAAALWASGGPSGGRAADTPVLGFVASVALAVMAFKGFTTITNSGGEMVNPKRNVGRAIAVSVAICAAVYLVVAGAVAASLTMEEIVAAKDYALARAAEPVLGDWGFYLTVALALVATASGVLASLFAVSRMLTMLTDMKMIPHSHFGMSGPIQRHMLVYTVVLAALSTILFDLTRIASLGVFLYLVMDMIVHWGVLRRVREEVAARGWVLVCAMLLDAAVLGAFAISKLRSDPAIVGIAAGVIVVVFALERLYVRRWVA